MDKLLDSILLDMLTKCKVENKLDDFGLWEELPPIRSSRVLGLNNGHEIRYTIAPSNNEKLSVLEIDEYIKMQIRNLMNRPTYSDDYNVGYRDALEDICLFIKKRNEEDLNKKTETNDNCC